MADNGNTHSKSPVCLVVAAPSDIAADYIVVRDDSTNRIVNSGHGSQPLTPETADATARDIERAYQTAERAIRLASDVQNIVLDAYYENRFAPDELAASMSEVYELLESDKGRTEKLAESFGGCDSPYQCSGQTFRTAHHGAMIWLSHTESNYRFSGGLSEPADIVLKQMPGAFVAWWSCEFKLLDQGLFVGIQQERQRWLKQLHSESRPALELRRDKSLSGTGDASNCEWSKPLSLAAVAKRFGVCARTFQKRYVDSGRVQLDRIGPRLYRIPIAQFPPAKRD